MVPVSFCAFENFSLRILDTCFDVFHWVSQNILGIFEHWHQYFTDVINIASFTTNHELSETRNWCWRRLIRIHFISICQSFSRSKQTQIRTRFAWNWKGFMRHGPWKHAPHILIIHRYLQDCILLRFFRAETASNTDNLWRENFLFLIFVSLFSSWLPSDVCLSRIIFKFQTQGIYSWSINYTSSATLPTILSDMYCRCPSWLHYRFRYTLPCFSDHSWILK